MAKKYLKYFVTREDQKVTEEFVDYISNFPKEKHLLNTMSIHSWHFYEMAQSAFYCNWPNTNFRNYFIQAELFKINKTTNICDIGIYDYWGVLFTNPNDHKVSFNLGDLTQDIVLDSPTILISPHQNERCVIEIENKPMNIIKFKINSSLGIEENWIPF